MHARAADDPLLALAGAGAHLFFGEDPNEYVRRLREEGE